MAKYKQSEPKRRRLTNSTQARGDGLPSRPALETTNINCRCPATADGNVGINHQKFYKHELSIKGFVSWG